MRACIDAAVGGGVFEIEGSRVKAGHAGEIPALTGVGCRQGCATVRVRLPLLPSGPGGVCPP